MRQSLEQVQVHGMQPGWDGGWVCTTMVSHDEVICVLPSRAMSNMYF